MGVWPLAHISSSFETSPSPLVFWAILDQCLENLIKKYKETLLVKSRFDRFPFFDSRILSFAILGEGVANDSSLDMIWLIIYRSYFYYFVFLLLQQFLLICLLLIHSNIFRWEICKRDRGHHVDSVDRLSHPNGNWWACSVSIIV